MADLTRQQFCAELGISESTVRRLELDGLPFTPVGRGKRYDLAECKRWLRGAQVSIWTDKAGRRHVGVMVAGKRVHRILPASASAGDAKRLEAESKRGLALRALALLASCAI